MSYGKSWEKFPIEKNEIWKCGNSSIAINDLTTGMPSFMYNADMIYMDGPWSLANVNMFNTKSDREKMVGFSEFYNPMFNHIKRINPKVVYLEIGERNLDLFKSKLNYFPHVDCWPILYYDKHRCYLLRGALTPYAGEDLSEKDDTITPLIAIRAEKPTYIADMCTGRGLTGLAAHEFGCDFVGTELNKRKLSVFIERASKKGFKYERS